VSVLACVRERRIQRETDREKEREREGERFEVIDG